MQQAIINILWLLTRYNCWEMKQNGSFTKKLSTSVLDHLFTFVKTVVLQLTAIWNKLEKFAKRHQEPVCSHHR